MKFIDDEVSGDWTKQTFDLYASELNYRRPEYDDELESVLTNMGVTLEKFKTLPAYQGYLRIRKGAISTGDGEDQ